MTIVISYGRLHQRIFYALPLFTTSAAGADTLEYVGMWEEPTIHRPAFAPRTILQADCLR
jgi:hypothetical protein